MSPAVASVTAPADSPKIRNRVSPAGASGAAVKTRETRETLPGGVVCEPSVLDGRGRVTEMRGDTG